MRDYVNAVIGCLGPFEVTRTWATLNDVEHIRQVANHLSRLLRLEPASDQRNAERVLRMSLAQ